VIQRELPSGDSHRDLLEARYGSRFDRRARRWVRWILLGVVILAGGVVAVVAYRNLGPQPITGTQTALVFSDRSVRITFVVTRDHPERPGDCIVRALSRDGAEVGRKEVYVPAAGGSIQLTTVLHTSNQPVTGDVYGCTYRVPPYMTTAVPPSG
jgi:hypothetical protein